MRKCFGRFASGWMLMKRLHGRCAKRLPSTLYLEEGPLSTLSSSRIQILQIDTRRRPLLRCRPVVAKPEHARQNGEDGEKKIYDAKGRLIEEERLIPAVAPLLSIAPGAGETSPPLQSELDVINSVPTIADAKARQNNVDMPRLAEYVCNRAAVLQMIKASVTFIGDDDDEHYKGCVQSAKTLVIAIMNGLGSWEDKVKHHIEGSPGSKFLTEFQAEAKGIWKAFPKGSHPSFDTLHDMHRPDTQRDARVLFTAQSVILIHKTLILTQLKCTANLPLSRLNLTTMPLLFSTDTPAPKRVGLIFLTETPPVRSPPPARSPHQTTPPRPAAAQKGGKPRQTQGPRTSRHQAALRHAALNASGHCGPGTWGLPVRDLRASAPASLWRPRPTHRG